MNDEKQPPPPAEPSQVKEDEKEVATIDLQQITSFQQQISRLDQGQAVQIPAGVLTSLLTSIVNYGSQLTMLTTDLNKTKEIIGRDRQEIHHLRRDLAVFHKRDGVKFSWFPRLPTEIRLLAWKNVLLVPRVDCFTIHGAVLTPTQAIYDVCREARDLAKSEEKVYQIEHHKKHPLI